MAISHSVIRIGPTFGNFNAAKKRQPLIQRKLASTPVITQGNGDYGVIPSKVYLDFFYGLDGRQIEMLAMRQSKRQTMNSCAAIKQIKVYRQ